MLNYGISLFELENTSVGRWNIISFDFADIFFGINMSGIGIPIPSIGLNAHCVLSDHKD